MIVTNSVMNYSKIRLRDFRIKSFNLIHPNFVIKCINVSIKYKSLRVNSYHFIFANTIIFVIKEYKFIKKKPVKKLMKKAR